MRFFGFRGLIGAAVLLAGCGGDSFTAAPGSGGKSGGGASGAAGAASSSGGKGGNTGGAGTAGAGSGAGGATNGGTTGSGGNVANGGAGGGVSAGGATTVVDAGPPATWCDSQKAALFCEDFDKTADVVTLLNSWSNYSSAGADFTLDNGGGVPSLPNALRVRTNVAHDVKALLAENIPPFQTPPRRMLLEFALRIDAGADVGILSGAALAAILLGSDVSAGAMALEIGNGWDPLESTCRHASLSIL